MIAEGVLPATTKLTPPRDQVTVRLAPPARRVQVVRPTVGTPIYFDTSLDFEADVAGGDIARVQWRITAPGLARPLVDETSPVVVETGDKRRSHLTYKFVQAGGDRDVEVAAIACLPEGFPTTRPADSVTLKVQRRPLQFTIEAPDKSVLFGKPVQLRVQPVDQVASVTWDFDDGSTDSSGNIAPQHTYQCTGTFAVTADVTSKDGQKVKARRPDLVIMAEPAKARPVVHHASKAVGDRLYIGSIVELKDESTGGIVSHQWLLDGKPLPVGQATVELSDLGTHQIALQVQGPPDRSGNKPAPDTSSKDIPIVPLPEHWKFWGACIIVALALAFVYRLLFGNAPRAWKVYCNNTQTPNEEIDRAYSLKRYWNWWGLRRKYAEIPMSEVYDGSEYWAHGEGALETLTVDAIRTSNELEGTIKYSGEGNDRVTVVDPDRDGRKVDYVWADKRCSDSQYQVIRARLVMTRSNSLAPVFVSVMLLATALSFLAWMFFQVYHAGL